MRAIVLLGSFALFTTVNNAYASDQGWFVEGEGTRSCGQFIAAIGDTKPGKSFTFERDGVTYWSENQTFLQFANGYITAMNAIYPDKQIRLDPAAIELWLKNYCSKNPTDAFFVAVFKFTEAMRVKR